MSLNPPVDTIQEVNLLRNAFSTEYGQGQAVVSMVTKSGTNRRSFSAYEYFRDDALEAKNYFAVSKTPHERNQSVARSAVHCCATSCSCSAGMKACDRRRARSSSQTCRIRRI